MKYLTLVLFAVLASTAYAFDRHPVSLSCSEIGVVSVNPSYPVKIIDGKSYWFRNLYDGDGRWFVQVYDHVVKNYDYASFTHDFDCYETARSDGKL